MKKVMDALCKIFFCNYQCAFDDTLSVYHMFIKPLFRAQSQATHTPPPPPPLGCAVGGVVVIVFILQTQL
jgi:hypothetical protein